MTFYRHPSCFLLVSVPESVSLLGWLSKFGTFNTPIDLRVGGPTAVHTSPLHFIMPSSTHSRAHAHAHTSTSPTVCIPANCSHIDKSSSRQWAEEAVCMCDDPPLTCKWGIECFTLGRMSLTATQRKKKKKICICSAYKDLKTALTWELMLSLEVESEDNIWKKKTAEESLLRSFILWVSLAICPSR